MSSKDSVQSHSTRNDGSRVNEASVLSDPIVAELRAALRSCLRELRTVKDGYTGGVPNAIVACIPEAIEDAEIALINSGEPLDAVQSI